MAKNGQDAEQLGTDLEQLLKGLTIDQLRYVSARAQCTTDQQAADAAHISRSTLTRWKQDAPIDEVVRLIAQDSVLVAREKLRRAAAQAVDVLTDDLEARRHSKIRQDAAKDVLDRLGVKAPQQVDVTATGDLRIEYINDWRGNAE